jgi:transposase
MKDTRTRHSAAFKTKVALEAIREQYTAPEIARRHCVHVNLVYKWKKQFLDRASSVFQLETSDAASSEREDQLLKKIGELTVERDFLSNGLSRCR